MGHHVKTKLLTATAAAIASAMSRGGVGVETIGTIAICPSGSTLAGSLERFAQTGPIDDFAFLADDSNAAASRNQAAIGITPDGTVTILLADGREACTPLLPFGEAEELIVLTTGNLPEGRTEAARIFAIPSPVRN